MKQIIPFKKELLFKTKVSEITSISLEHTLDLKKEDQIHGEFHITGDYKMTEGSINREKFNFTLPFDIDLDTNYNMDTIIIDIDNFYYEVINNEALQVNIDVYVEGEKIPEEVLLENNPTADAEPEEMREITFPITIDADLETTVTSQERNEKPEESAPILSKEEALEDKIEILEPLIERPTIESISLEEESTTKTTKKDFNIFENIDNSDTYVTYHVYIVKETDTLDQILKKYEVTKENMALYNNLEDIKPGTKLIIPNE